jgi:ribosomal protein L37AE/L43A
MEACFNCGAPARALTETGQWLCMKCLYEYMGVSECVKPQS